MKRGVLVLEAINATAGILVNLTALQNNAVLGIPIAYWNSVFFGLFFFGFSFLYWNENKIKVELRNSILNEIRGEIRESVTSVVEKPEGTLDGVTSQDRLLIQAMAIDMAIGHGYLDFVGLLADRASGISLNELMSRPCSVCGISRDTRSNKWGKG